MKPTPNTLQSIRDRIAALQRQIDDVEGQPLSREEVRATVKDQIKRAGAVRSARMAHVVEALARSGAWPVHASLFDVTTSPPAERHMPARVDIGEILAAVVGPEALMSAIDPFVDALPDGITASDRLAQIASLKARLFAAGVDEERFISDLETRGQTVARRSDSDPAAVLYLPAELL